MSIADVRRNGGSIFVMNSALDLIGNTPMVDVSNLSPNPNVRIVAKLESQNPYGSVKDRIAVNIINDLEKSGKLKPGGTIIEATSGNTGAGLAMVAASPALLWQYTMAWSEPPFLVLELAACVVALRTWRPWRWPLLAALCAAMGFVRYVGPVFAAAVVAGGLVADLARRRTVGTVARSVMRTDGILARVSSMPPTSRRSRSRH